MTYVFCPAVVPPNYFKLNEKATCVVPLNVIHPELEIEEKFVIKRPERSLVHIASVYTSVPELGKLSLHRTKIHFLYHDT